MNIEQHKLIDGETALALLNDIKALHPARFVPNMSNIGMDGSVGTYSSAFSATLPKNLVDRLTTIAPNKEPLSLAKIAINKYAPGGYIPRHIDSHEYFECEILTLEDSQDGLWFIEGNSEKFNRDKAGYCNKFCNLKTVHWIEPVFSERYSVIFLYSYIL